MRNRITALIIDPEKNQHDYENVKVSKVWDTYEDGFDIKVIENTDKLYQEMSDFRGIDCIITISENINFDPLNNLSFDFRKKWIHKDNFNADDIAYSIIAVFEGNIIRETPQENKLFSIFTCTFNTKHEYLDRLYKSLKAQTYHDWNWFVLDDSPNDETYNYINSYGDPRITIFRNITNHGSIGFNKHTIAMLCNGDYLVEVDHDDELLPNCLSELKKAFDTYPDTDFVYSYVLENIDGRAVWYGDEWGRNGWGGGYMQYYVKGLTYKVALQDNITPISIRTIFTQPNHVRCWKKDFYHRIGGHNSDFGILDDADLLIRTFLNGKMTKVSKVLYIQYESGSRQGTGDNTQSKRFQEIQRTSHILKKKYDEAIHQRIIELGYNDCCWENNAQMSDIHKDGMKDIPIMNYII